MGVPGVLLGTALIEVPGVGRKWAMVGSSALMGVSLFLYAVVSTPAASVGFNAMEYFCESLPHPPPPPPAKVARGVGGLRRRHRGHPPLHLSGRGSQGSP